MDANSPQENQRDQSMAFQRLKNSEGTESKFSMKWVAALAALAIGGGGLTLYGRQAKGEAQEGQVVDSSASLKRANEIATGYDPKRDSRYVPNSGLPGYLPAPDSSNEQKMANLQTAARMGQPLGQANAGAPGSQSGPNGQNPAGASQQNQRSAGSARSGGGGPSAPASILPAHLRVRLHEDYRRWMETQASSAIAWSRSDAMSTSGIAGQGPQGQGQGQQGAVPGVDPALQNLYPASTGPSGYGRSFYMPAGSEITCVTDHPINTDYPGSIRATVVAPEPIKGASVIVTASGVNIERANASVKKLVVNRNSAWTEYTLAGEIRTDLPALNGIVNHHYARRILPAVINAGLAGGAIALSSQTDNQGISTKDQIYNSMAVAGINGIQTEIGKINEGKPAVTVVVPSGQEFQILLTSGLEIK